MKLAFCLFHYFPYGGLQQDFLIVLKECIARGHHIDVYTMQWEGEYPLEIQLHCLPQKAITNHGRAKAFSKQMQQIFLKKTYDAIIGFNKMPGLDIYFAADHCFIKDVPKYLRFLPRYLTYHRLEKAVFNPKMNTKILVLTEIQQKDFTAHYHTQPERFSLLPPYIEPAFQEIIYYLRRREICRTELGLSPSDKMILMVASFFSTKGVDRSLKALASLPFPAHLFIIGGDDPSPYLSFIKKSGISHIVHFLGAQKNVMPFYAAADLFFHPAYREAGGKVLIEALMANLPILTTNVCGHSIHVSNAKAGIVLPSPFEQKQCNQALLSLLEKPLDKLRENVTSYIKSRNFFGLGKIVADFIEDVGARHAVPLRVKNDIFDYVFNLKGEVFRTQPGRQTLRFIENNQAYFLKRHTGISFYEIFKNLIQGRLPVWGAKNEVDAILALEKFGFVPEIVDYGFRGKLSFIITKELMNTISLEVGARRAVPLPLKWTLIRKIASIAKTIHDHGINHRDFYLCHFLLDPTTLKLYVIDWHRAQIRKKVPFRWRVKDIAGLYFSAMDIGLTQRDLYRFMKIYDDPKDAYFWQCVKKRAIRLYRKENSHV
jgi:UDP-glucose:(heptosyl)LPS alpha-1,3-glucosyltransferase